MPPSTWGAESVRVVIEPWQSMAKTVVLLLLWVPVARRRYPKRPVVSKAMPPRVSTPESVANRLACPAGSTRAMPGGDVRSRTNRSSAFQAHEAPSTASAGAITKYGSAFGSVLKPSGPAAKGVVAPVLDIRYRRPAAITTSEPSARAPTSTTPGIFCHCSHAAWSAKDGPATQAAPSASAATMTRKRTESDCRHGVAGDVSHSAKPVPGALAEPTPSVARLVTTLRPLGRECTPSADFWGVPARSAPH